MMDSSDVNSIAAAITPSISQIPPSISNNVMFLGEKSKNEMKFDDEGKKELMYDLEFEVQEENAVWSSSMSSSSITFGIILDSLTISHLPYMNNALQLMLYDPKYLVSPPLQNQQILPLQSIPAHIWAHTPWR